VRACKERGERKEFRGRERLKVRDIAEGEGEGEGERDERVGFSRVRVFLLAHMFVFELGGEEACLSACVHGKD
jgi:hypothetical protein